MVSTDRSVDAAGVVGTSWSVASCSRVSLATKLVVVTAASPPIAA